MSPKRKNPVKKTKAASPQKTAKAVKTEKSIQADRRPALAQEVRKVADILIENKAEQIVVLDFRKEGFFSDYFIIATGLSDTHLETLMSALVRNSTDSGAHIIRRKADAGSGWLLADLGDMIVHLFLRETRGRYDLENLWNYVKKTEVG